MAYVYQHIRLDTNEIFYIGIGVRSKHRRARTIVSRNEFWKNITSKTDWKAEIIFDEISLDDAKIKEVELIKQIGRRDLGNGTLVNLTNGGDGTFGYAVTEQTKLKLSKFNTGKKLSEEHKAKIAKSNTGKVTSAAALQKMSMAKIGKKQSKETIDKRRLKLMGNKSNTGRKLSEEHKFNMKQAQIKRRLLEMSSKND
jgi:hypothetical protein